MTQLPAFEALGLSPAMLEACAKKGFEEPTSIQKQCIPLLLGEDTDIVGQAQTGTGKTAAFGIPLIEKLANTAKKVQALILAPTRELALQISEEINSFAQGRNLEIAAVYGGQSMPLQIRRLQKGVHIVVGTPGRVIDHIERGTLNLSTIRYVILDEADEMLNMGFIEDIEKILSHVPAERNMLLFSATMPDRILSLAKKHMREYKHIKIAKTQMQAALTDQIYFEVNESDRFEALTRIIDMETEFYGLVFCRTKVDVDNVSRKLVDRGFDAEGLHGDHAQAVRESILHKFKTKKITVLVATDVAARGIDVSDLTHVINYALPQDPESYVHRIGRTGRAGKQGTAITFITPSEYRKLGFIQRITKTEIKKKTLPEVDEIIEIKRQRIMAIIAKVIEEGALDDYQVMAKEILNSSSPETALAALIKQSFSQDLDASRYAVIRTPGSPDRQGNTRLFIAKGRKDEMTKKLLVEFIINKVKTPGHLINDVQVYESFSFISVPLREAERILEFFQKAGRDGKPLVTKAGPKEGGPSGSGGYRGGFDRGSKGGRSDYAGKGKKEYSKYGDKSSAGTSRPRTEGGSSRPTASSTSRGPHAMESGEFFKKSTKRPYKKKD